MSHCWGRLDAEKPTTTTTENLNERKAGIAMEELSPIFRDAIQLCRSVGCRYIWIDSLCIIQDDDSDWIEQSQAMALIYSNAYFNIAATCQPDGSFGLFEVPPIPYGRSLPRREIEIKPGVGSRVLARQDCHRDHEFVQGTHPFYSRRSAEAPLLERAWVFQEILLARRNIHFCRSELIWECRTTSHCECGGVLQESESLRRGQERPMKQQFALIHRNILSLSPSLQTLYDFWLEAAELYSHIALTKLPDRFYALSGIASILKTRTNDWYVAGLWAGELPRSLLWTGISKSCRFVRRTGMAPT
jgi:hypothetical protein